MDGSDGSSDGNVYVRLTLVQPKPGNAEHVSQLLADLIVFYSAQPGYLQSYLLVSPGRENELGRITLWRSEQDADHVASSDHVLALHSELIGLVEDQTHRERSFVGQPGPAAHAAAI